MKEIIELLEKTDGIYDKKLDDAIALLEETDVKDDLFDKLINRVSNLIGLKIQKVQFIENYNNEEVK